MMLNWKADFYKQRLKTFSIAQSPHNLISLATVKTLKYPLQCCQQNVRHTLLDVATMGRLNNKHRI